MNRRVQFGIALPQIFPHEPIQTARIRDVLARAEALNFHSVWVQEQILGPTPSLEPVELLTYAAAVTERLRLGTAVLLTALRSPVHLAKSLATLDHLSQGRLIVGLGLGGNTRVYPAYGISTDHRVARFVEGVKLMKQLWTEPHVTFEGQFWRIDRASIEPKPVQKPYPPIWLGAHRAPAIRRGVELGDGFIGAGASSTAEFVEAVRMLRAFLADAHRDPATFSICKRVYMAVDKDKARAGRRLVEWFSSFYQNASLAERVSVWGDTQECIDKLTEIVAGGAGLIILNPVFDEMEQLERLAMEVLPRVSG